MHKPIPMANALTIVGLGLYVGCRIAALIVPDLFFAVGQSWLHNFNLNAIKAVPTFDLGTFLLGGITWGVLVWVTAYSATSLYNKLAK